VEIDLSLELRLLDACVEGDTRAWSELHRRYFPVAESFLRKLGVPREDLEDTLQEVFLQVYNYLPRFRRGARLSTWLYRICITQARAARRRTRLRLLLRSPFANESHEAAVPPSNSESAALQRLHDALAGLPEVERAAFILYEMEGLPGKQIAKILGWPEASVWPRLHYARKAVRRAFGEDPEQD
jgi:RNA polymerase sigma-70 factor (ECF subfamily)